MCYFFKALGLFLFFRPLLIQIRIVFCSHYLPVFLAMICSVVSSNEFSSAIYAISSRFSLLHQSPFFSWVWNNCISCHPMALTWNTCIYNRFLVERLYIASNRPCGGMHFQGIDKYHPWVATSSCFALVPSIFMVHLFSNSDASSWDMSCSSIESKSR